MKKSFYDLMDFYEPDEYEKQYEISSENVKEKVMDRIKANGKKRKIRLTSKVFALASAAAVAAVFSIAVAAYEMGVFDKAVNFFENQQTLNSQSRVLSDCDMSAIQSNLKEESVAVESNGTTIELTGSMYDNCVAYFFFKVTAPEGTVLDQEQYEFDDMMFDLDSSSVNGSASAGGGITFNDDDLQDNVTYFTYDFNCQGVSIEGFKGIHFQNLIMPGNKAGYYPSEKILDGEWYIPVKVGEREKVIELLDEPTEADVVSAVTGESYKMSLSYCEISPLSIRFEAASVTDYDSASEDIVQELQIVMKDGSIYDDYNNTCGTTDNFGFIFGKPLNLSDIDYVQLGGMKLTCSFE